MKEASGGRIEGLRSEGEGRQCHKAEYVREDKVQIGSREGEAEGRGN